MTGMCTSLKVLMRCIRAGWAMGIFLVLALEIWGEHRMDRAAMDMIRIPMAMIRLGMHVK